MTHSTHHADYQVLLSLFKAARGRARFTQVALDEKPGVPKHLFQNMRVVSADLT